VTLRHQFILVRVNFCHPKAGLQNSHMAAALLLKSRGLSRTQITAAFLLSPVQFYKNLSTCLEDVVWKTEEDMQEMK
jgi:hypothetical protein